MAPAKKSRPLKATAAKKSKPRLEPRLAKAFNKAAKLSPKAQKALAKCLLEQLDLIEDETLWMATFAATQDQLARWADEVMKDITIENTEPLDLDRLSK